MIKNKDTYIKIFFLIIALLVLTVAMACTSPTTVYVPSGSAVQLRQPIENVKVWVRTDNNIEPAQMTIPEGWYCLELPNEK